MINPAPPIHAPGRFVGKFSCSTTLGLSHGILKRHGHDIDTGAWMDGWETKRHNPNYDW